MKLSVFFMLISFLGVFASETYSQNINLSVKGENISLEEFLIKIENQSEFRFFYAGKIDVEKKISREYKNKKITEILDDIKDEAGIQYEVMGRQIILSPNDAESAMKSIQQQRTISGKVTDSSGEPLPGVTVVVKGTTQGTITNADGGYSLAGVLSDATLVFSFVGMEQKEVPVSGNTTLNVSLSENTVDVAEVVVTALNISRDKKSLGYSVQQVNTEELTIARSNDLSTALAGKIAGIQTYGSASSTFDAAKIRIRGVNDLEGNGPLYVVDGTPISHGDVDLTNVESVSVLKGPSASALYGQRAARGVILVTTKKGTRNKKLSIEINSTTKVEELATFPDLQNEYGQGNQRANGEAYEFPLFSYNPSLHPQEWQAWDGHPIVDYATEMSWGPKMDGQLVREWFSWYKNDPEYGKLTPFSPSSNNIEDFYRTGVSLNNDIAISGGGDNYNFRTAYSNQSRSLIYPGSERNRHFFNISGSFDINDKLNFNTSVNIIKDHIEGNPTASTNVNTILQRGLPRQIDVNKLRDYKDGEFRFRSWNLGNPNALTPADFLYNKQVSSNPFIEVFDNVRNDYLTRIYGFAQLKYDFTKDISVQATYRTDQNSGHYDSKVVSGSRPDNADGTSRDYFAQAFHSSEENNYELLFSIKKRFNKFSVDANAGGNIRTFRQFMLNSETVGGLKTPGVYAIAQSYKKSNSWDTFNELETRSIYGQVSLGYNEIIYIDGSVRNDWSSTLPDHNNSYLYPSISTSFIFSELMRDSDLSHLISFGKLRFGMAQVGSDLDAYNVHTTLPLSSSYGLYPGQAYSETLLNPDIKPTLSTSWDAGIEMKFLKNRLGFDFAVYKNQNKNQILTMAIPNVSGYNNMIVNAGLIETEGFDLSLYATPVKSRAIQWDVNFNVGKTKSLVKKLAEGQKELLVAWEFTNLKAWHIEGKEWMFLRGRKFMRYQATDAKGNPIYHPNNGKIVVNEQGGFLLDENQDFGKALPDYTGGLGNTFNYKDLYLSCFIDYQFGGKMFSQTNTLMDWKGYSEKTVGLNDLGNNIRLPLSEGGGIKPDAVTPDGEIFDHYIKAQDYFGTYWWLSEPYVYSSDYIKLREIRVGYELPKRWFNNTMFESINVSLVMNNVLLIYNAAKDSGMDPSELNTNYGESGQLPATRSIGFNLNVTL